MMQVMGPPSALSECPSTMGSSGSSEWGREYEDEDTWYVTRSNLSVILHFAFAFYFQPRGDIS